MTTVAQLASVIRYHLAELGARNGHHEFEHLARHLARARVYSNILPATGPVSAGGDHGRDFETYKTQITFPVTAGATFSQMASGERCVVFACTLQKTIVPKIEKDIETILRSGSVDEVIYFCEANLPVAKRKKLQAWAQQRGVLLQVFDGQAVAEMLADRDTFWIAQDFLRIPSEMMPRAEDDPNWYSELGNRWTNKKPFALSRADFIEIKAGLRHATFNLNVRSDLNKWLTLMGYFLAEDVPRQLQRTAAYEVVVATYRGKGDFSSKYFLFENFYLDFLEFTGLADLQDAATLLVYAWGALTPEGGTDIAVLFKLRNELASLLEQEITNAPGHGRRAGLFQILGHLAFMPAEVGMAPDMRGMAKYWSHMLDEVAHTPLFPVEAFADHLSKLLAKIGPQPELLPLTERVDEYVASRAGAAVAGQKAFERGQAFLEVGDKLAAMQEFHRARKRWFSGDRIAEVLSVMLILSDCYRELGLAYAAKYYALSVAYLAVHEQKQHVNQLLPRAMFIAVDAEDSAGNGVGLINLLGLALGAHVTLEREPFNSDLHPRLQENLGQMQALLGFLRRGDPVLFEAIKPAFAAWPSEFSSPMLEGCCDPSSFWNRGEWGDVWRDLENAFVDRPWGDLASIREVRWNALGIAWLFRFSNAYEDVAIAEEFIAQCQLASAAFAISAIDLALVPTSVTFGLSISKKTKKLKLKELQCDNGGLSFSLTIPSSVSSGIEVKETLSLFSAILGSCSAFRDEQFMLTARQGLVAAAEQAFNLRPYNEVFKEFVHQDAFFAFARTSQDGFQREMPFKPMAVDEIGWICGIGPTYDQDKAGIGIADRYATWIPYVRFSVRNLMREPGSRAMLRELRARGMKDWQILSIVGNIAFSARAPVDFSGGVTKSIASAAKAAIAVAETEESALGPDVLSPEIIQMQEVVFISLMLNHWELSVDSALINSPALGKFLVVRYRIQEDDVDHEDVFGWNEPASV